jgi:capsular exopolysaccharide synthesis family protein
VIVSLILSLGAGVALALGLEFLDYTVKSPESLERAYGVPAQGVVGVVPGQNQRIEGKANPAYQLTVSAPQSPAAESVRSLRTSVQIAGLNRSIRSILITSAGPGEGKTFIAANLAVSIAQYGGSVILVDLDLRKPTLHGAFGLPREPGFTNLVIGRDGDTLETIRPQIDTILQRAHNRDALRHQGGVAAGLSLSLTSARSLLQDVETDDPEVKLMIADVHHQIDRSDDFAGYLQPSGVPNLRVLTCGTIPPNPSELLGSPRAAALMARLEEIADVVVYDSPPAGIVTDAVILAPRMDAIIQVVRAGKTRIDLMRRCKTMIEHASGKLLGPVLNQVRLSEMGSYSYYYYYGYSDKSNDRRSRNGASQHNGRNGTGPGDTGRKG